MKHFKVSDQGDYLHIGFFAPSSANALSLAAARELGSLQKRFKGQYKPVVFTSAHPRVFCSGGNLSDYKKLKSAAAGLKVNREITAILDDFAKWPVPKLAVIEGDVLGGGMEWLARFDFRWTTPSPLFSFWQRRIGLSTGWGGGRAWCERLSEAQVRALLTEARLLSAPEALRLGLVDRVIADWQAVEEIAVWARSFSNAPMKSLLSWSAKTENRLFSKLWMGPEHRRALERWKG